HLDFHLFSDLCADQLVLKSRDERAGSDRQRIVFSLSALESLAVYESFKVQSHLVLILDSSVCNLDCSCVALALFLDLCINLFICRLYRDFIHFQSFIFTECDFRLHCNLSSKDERFALLKPCNINLRLGYDLKLTLII